MSVLSFLQLHACLRPCSNGGMGSGGGGSLRSRYTATPATPPPALPPPAPTPAPVPAAAAALAASALGRAGSEGWARPAAAAPPAIGPQHYAPGAAWGANGNGYHTQGSHHMGISPRTTGTGEARFPPIFLLFASQPQQRLQRQGPGAVAMISCSSWQLGPVAVTRL
jgi:hypothetical protein